MLHTTCGQVLVNSTLPKELQDYSRVIDKKGMNDLMEQLQQHTTPDEFRDTIQKLFTTGHQSAHTSGFSLSIKSLEAQPALKVKLDDLRKRVNIILAQKNLTTEEQGEMIKNIVGARTKDVEDTTFNQGVLDKNPFATQVISGSRGSRPDMRSLVAGDLLVTDHRNRVIPMPILSSYSKGLDPAEYWAGSYGGRKGTICLDENTEVLLSDYSSKKIKDIVVGDRVLGSDAQGCISSVLVRAVYNSGEQLCYSYSFRVNWSSRLVTLVATDSHRMLARLKGKNDTYAGAKYSLIPLGAGKLYPKTGKSTYVAIPAHGEDLRSKLGKNEEFALLVGLMLGDDCLAPSTRGRYIFSCADKKLLRDVAGYLSSFGVTLHKSFEKQYGYVLCEKDGKDGPVKQYLKEVMGETLAHNKELPKDVYSWNINSAARLVSGLFSTGGSVYRRGKGCSISFASTSRKMIDQLRRLLELRFGIWCSDIFAQGTERDAHATHSLYSFTISHSVAVEKFYLAIPLVGVKANKLKKFRVKSKAQNSSYCFKMVSKELVGHIQTRDIEVDSSNHMFLLANGLVSGNSTKFAVQEAGFFGKKLVQAAHRNVVTEKDCGTARGISVPANDPDNVGSILAGNYGPYKLGQIVDGRIGKTLGDQEILVRSPITCQAKSGLCSLCTGVRETGALPSIGDNVGVAAAQALAERISQGMLNVKHTGGRATGKEDRKGHGGGMGGVALIKQMTEIPSSFKNAATLASVDGIVQGVTTLPQGGSTISVGGVEHYVPPDTGIKVKAGDRVETGDIMTEGIPNPAEIVRYRGVGDGRLVFTKAFKDAFRANDMPANRRNIEILSRGLINHVRVTDTDGPEGALPDDLIEYGNMERDYKPRHGTVAKKPKAAVGMYLERPDLQYSIGTKINHRVAADLEKHGVHEIMAHADAPSFEPEMVRDIENLAQSPDWQVRLGGWGLEKGIIEATVRSRDSKEHSTSFIPGLARAKDFGQDLNASGIY